MKAGIALIFLLTTIVGSMNSQIIDVDSSTGETPVRSSDGKFMQQVSLWNHSNKVLRALVTVPDEEGYFPVIVAIHGGGFTSGDRKRFDSSFHNHFLKVFMT